MWCVSMVDIDAICLLSVVSLLNWIMTSFLRYTGYLNLIKDHMR